MWQSINFRSYTHSGVDYIDISLAVLCHMSKHLLDFNTSASSIQPRLMQCQSFWLRNMQLQPNKSRELNSCMSECLVWDIDALIKFECILASVWSVVRTSFIFWSEHCKLPLLASLILTVCNFYLHKKPCTENWNRTNKCMHFVIYFQKLINVLQSGVFFMEQSRRATWKILIFE